MSMSEWTEEGYGTELFNGENLNKICDFIIKYDPEINSEPLKNAEDIDEIEYIIDMPVSWEIAKIINKLENTIIFKGYKACDDTEQKEMIGIQPVWPWESREEDISQYGCEMLFEKYAQMLGIDKIPEFFTAHYYG